MKYLLIVLLAALTLVGCRSSMPLAPVSCQWPPIPANLKQPCPPLPKLQTGAMPELAGAALTDALTYSDCRARHWLLIQAVKARESKGDANAQ